MQTRRRFLTVLALGPLLAGWVASAARSVLAASRKVLDRTTRREGLIHENPAALDASNLPVTPLEQFGTMGPTDEAIDGSAWRLRIAGAVAQPLQLSYAELTALPPLERDVLLICPGFFANHGRWRGVSLRPLLERAGAGAGGTVLITGRGGKDQRFPMAEVQADQVFLAYAVNGEPLPRKHGFPLRVVAADHYGSDWVKYVEQVTVERG